MKSFIKSIFEILTLGLLKTKRGQNKVENESDSCMNQTKEVIHNGQSMFFTAPNWVNDFRIDTFSTKEPETLEWINQIPEGSVLWDVGANIGLYSIYASKAQNCQVYAFEPSVFNLELLARNIFINSLQDRITIVPIALSNSIGVNTFKMSNTMWGGALSTFGESFNQNGEMIDKVFEYRTIGISMDDVIEIFHIPLPQYVKIDVDGLEHFILRAGKNVINQVQEVLIEINDDFDAQARESTQILKECGLSLLKKCDIDSPNQYNQWWVRDSESVLAK